MNKETAGYVCVECGLKHGDTKGGVSTFHEGKCDMCGEIKSITSVRHYNWLRKFK